MLVAHAESVLGLVDDGAAGAAVNLAVLGAAHLVGQGLAGRLIRVGLGATAVIVSYGAMVEGDLGGTYRATLSPVSVKASFIFCWVDLEESGVISSLALVEKSLRPASDMLVIWWCVWGLVCWVCG